MRTGRKGSGCGEVVHESAEKRLRGPEYIV